MKIRNKRPSVHHWYFCPMVLTTDEEGTMKGNLIEKPCLPSGGKKLFFFQPASLDVIKTS